MSTLKFSGNLELMTVSLASDYTAASGSMVLTAGHGARLPSAGDFWIRTKTGTYRCFKVTARSTDTLTVTAAQDGTSDGNLSAGMELFWDLGAAALDQLLAERNRVLTVSQFDGLAAGEYRNGDRIVLSNGLYEVVRNGGAWDYLYQGRKVTRPPSTGWSWDNQAGGTIDSTNGYEYLSVPDQANSTEITARYRTAPATPYTVKMLLRHDISGAPPGASGSAIAVGYGMVFRDAAAKLITLQMLRGSSLPEISTIKWTNSTTVSAAYVTYGPNVASPSTLDTVLRNDAWLAISDTGTNLVFYWSIEGLHWKQFDTQTRTDFFAAGPDAYGFIGYAKDSAVEVALISLEETDSATP